MLGNFLLSKQKSSMDESLLNIENNSSISIIAIDPLKFSQTYQTLLLHI
jgi:hypothetical protein